MLPGPESVTTEEKVFLAEAQLSSLHEESEPTEVGGFREGESAAHAAHRPKSPTVNLEMNHLPRGSAFLTPRKHRAGPTTRKRHH